MLVCATHDVFCLLELHRLYLSEVLALQTSRSARLNCQTDLFTPGPPHPHLSCPNAAQGEPEAWSTLRLAPDCKINKNNHVTPSGCLANQPRRWHSCLHALELNKKQLAHSETEFQRQIKMKMKIWS